MYRSKWKQALESANITEEDLLKGTKSMLEEFKDSEQRYRAILKSGQLDDAPEKLEEVEKALERDDNEICKRIAKTNTDKERIAKMQAARGKNSSGVTNTASSTQQTTKPAAATTTQTKATGGAVKSEEPKKEEESSIFGWLLGAAGIAAAVVLGIKIKKG